MVIYCRSRRLLPSLCIYQVLLGDVGTCCKQLGKGNKTESTGRSKPEMLDHTARDATDRPRARHMELKLGLNLNVRFVYQWLVCYTVIMKRDRLSLVKCVHYRLWA